MWETPRKILKLLLWKIQYVFFYLPRNQYQRWSLCDAEVRLHGSYLFYIHSICHHQLVTNIHIHNSIFFFLTSFKCSTDLNVLLRLTSFWHDIYPRITSRTPIHKNHYFQPSVILPFRKIPFFSSCLFGFWLVAWLILGFALFYFVLFQFRKVLGLTTWIAI